MIEATPLFSAEAMAASTAPAVADMINEVARVVAEQVIGEDAVRTISTASNRIGEAAHNIGQSVVDKARQIKVPRIFQKVKNYDMEKDNLNQYHKRSRTSSRTFIQFNNNKKTNINGIYTQ
jgi:hypothetical protein